MFAFSPQPRLSLGLFGTLLALLSLAPAPQAAAQDLEIGSGEVFENTGFLRVESIRNEGELINSEDLRASRDVQNVFGKIVNAGRFESSGDIDNSEGTIENAGTIESFGAINNSGGMLQNAGTFDGVGDIDNSFGTIENSGTFDSFGDIDNSLGTIENSGTFDSFGDIDNSLGTIENSGTFEYTGRILGDRGTIENAGTFTQRGDIRGDRIDILNSGIFHLNGLIEGKDTSFTQTEGTVVIGIGGSYDGDDFDVTGGTVRGEGGSLRAKEATTSFSFRDTTLSLGNGDRELSVATGRLGSLAIRGDSLVDIVLDPDAGGFALLADRVAIQSDVMFEISFIDGAVIEDGDVFDLIAAESFRGIDALGPLSFTFPDTFGFEWDVAVASGAGQFGRDVLRATASAVAPVPLPAAAWLLGAGLLGLAGLTRRRKPA